MGLLNLLTVIYTKFTLIFLLQLILYVIYKRTIANIFKKLNRKQLHVYNFTIINKERKLVFDQYFVTT